MRKRLVLGTLAAVCMLVFPVLFSPTSGENLMNSAPFATVAIAGHVTSAGVYCNCNGTCEGSYLSVSPSGQSTSGQDGDQNSNDPATSDFNAGTMAILLIAMMYFGMRA